MALKVHFNRITFPEHLAVFESLLDQDITWTSGEDMPSPAEYDILVYPSPDEKWLTASPNLRAVIIPFAGVPQKTRECLVDFPELSLHNLHHNRFNTAEMALTLMLCAAKRIIPMDQALRQNNWEERYESPKAIVLRGKNALILGYGEIGQTLAGYCQGLGMQVTGIRKHPENNSGDEIPVWGMEKMHDLLAATDVLFIALPLTDETKDLMGDKELSSMPAGGIVVNIGRGPIINQHALYDALTSGHLRAAASDVWYHYPRTKDARNNTPPADVPFGELDNFILSPHRAGMVEDVEKQRIKALADLLNAANRGEPIPNKVNLETGY